MSEIQYNFAANNASLDEVNTHISGIAEVRADIANLFSILHTAYDGDGAAALEHAHQGVDRMLEDALTDASNTQKFAQDQQDTMQALDRSNAADF